MATTYTPEVTCKGRKSSNGERCGTWMRLNKDGFCTWHAHQAAALAAQEKALDEADQESHPECVACEHWKAKMLEANTKYERLHAKLLEMMS